MIGSAVIGGMSDGVFDDVIGIEPAQRRSLQEGKEKSICPRTMQGDLPLEPREPKSQNLCCEMNEAATLGKELGSLSSCHSLSSVWEGCMDMSRTISGKLYAHHNSINWISWVLMVLPR